jgi:hypothetical protein
MDVIFASVAGSNLPGDWIGALASQLGLEVGTSLLAYRFAVASDDRDDDTPPLSPWTRPATFSLPFPTPPAPGLAGNSRYVLDLDQSATIGTALRGEGAGTLLDVTVTCLGRDYGGPGVLTGEAVTYWAPPVAGIAVSPSSISFGTVAVGDVVDRTVTIASTGQLALQVTVAASPAGSPFHWPQHDVTVAPGASTSLSVSFAPSGAGAAAATLRVASNAAGSPASVVLHGTGSGKIRPR